MPRILGVDIPNNKMVAISLTYLYGVGNSTAGKIVEAAGIDPGKRAKDLTEDEISRIVSLLDKNYVIEGELRRQTAQNISRLRQINCYRGFRHARGLPVRGQRTKTNARTRKGRSRPIAGRKAPPRTK